MKPRRKLPTHKQMLDGLLDHFYTRVDSHLEWGSIEGTSVHDLDSELERDLIEYKSRRRVPKEQTR